MHRAGGAFVHRLRELSASALRLPRTAPRGDFDLIALRACCHSPDLSHSRVSIANGCATLTVISLQPSLNSWATQHRCGWASKRTT
jgi:hypothetical protein